MTRKNLQVQRRPVGYGGGLDVLLASIRTGCISPCSSIIDGVDSSDPGWGKQKPKPKKGPRTDRIELSDGEVELLRQMHEEHPAGHPEHLGIRKLAKIFSIPKNTTAKLCNYERR